MSDNTVPMACDFCGKQRSDVDKLIVANEAGICNECIELCSNILSKERRETLRKDKKIARALDPTKIKDYLDGYVIGQDDAKTVLSVAVVNHYKRVYFTPEIEIEKSNLLMFGPTGCGKTLLARCVAKYLNVPFTIADATTLTQAGYVGEDVETVVGRLLSAADNDVERCEQGIVFIDEIDKISRKSESASIHRDVGGEGVQQALLKLVEGTVCHVPIVGTKRGSQETVPVDTSNILFIAGGAFDGLDKLVSQRKNITGIGFTTKTQPENLEIKEVLPEDFMKFGMIPEFIGRFPVTVGLKEMQLEDLVRVLIEPKNSLIKQMQWYFETDSVELEFDDDAIIAIAQQTLEMKVGTRGLKTILERVLMTLQFNLLELKRQGISKIRITEAVINNQKEPEYIK
jgi:ATP-dependent Clp protease ATP-binding subunit ClpX